MSVRTFSVGSLASSLIALCVALSCSPTSSDPESSDDRGTPGGGGALGGRLGTVGGLPLAGAYMAGTGGAAAGGGATAKAGAGGTPSAGMSAGGALSSGGASSGATAGGAPSAAGATALAGAVTGTAGAATGSCNGTKGAATDLMIYSGGMGPACASSIATPRVGYWYAYNDATAGATQTPVKDALGSYPGEVGGKGGATDCAMHTKGTGFGKWGAGVGFDFNNVAAQSCPYDASAYTGIRFSAKGTASGTKGAAMPTENTLRVKLATPAMTGGDDFGVWCTLTPDWSVCEVPFASVMREGWDTMYPGVVFDKTKLVKIQFEAAKAGATGVAPTVAFDFWIDDVQFY